MTIKQSGYSAAQRYFFQGIRSQGWDTQSCIFELIDNSIDAYALSVDIDWKKDETLKTYTLTIKDDGGGILPEDMIESFCNLGSNVNYESDKIGNFGIGAKASLINLLTDGTAIIKSTTLEEGESDGSGRGFITSILPITHTTDDVEPQFEVESRKAKKGEEVGTTITIPNIKTNTTAALIKRFASVTYYPSSTRCRNFKIRVNGDEIKFVDPFYRDTNWNKADDFYSNDYRFKLGEDKYKLRITTFMPDFDKEKLTKYNWDTKKGTSMFRRDNSGLYIRVAGRYINTGKNLFPGYESSNIHTRMRMELNVPRDLMEDIGIQTNKSKVSLDVKGNPLLDELCTLIRSKSNEFVDEWRKVRGKQIDEKAKKAMKSANDLLHNQLIGKYPSMASGPLGAFVQKRKPGNKIGTFKPKNTGTKRNGKTKVSSKKDFKFQFVSDGRTNPMFDWKKENGVLYTDINVDTEWGRLVKNTGTDGHKLLPILAEIYSRIKIYLNRVSTAKSLGNDYEQVLSDIKDDLQDQTMELNKMMKDA